MPAVLDLAVYALLFFALALALVSKKVTAAALQTLAGWVSLVPGLGTALKNAVESVARAIDNALGSVVNGIEKAIGKSWHLQARLFEWALRELRAHARALLLIATPVGAIAAVVRGIRALVHRLEHAGHTVGGRVKSLEREYHGIEHRVKSLERKLTKGIGHDLRIRVAGLEDEVTTIEHKTIPAIRTLAHEAEADVTSLRKWITDNVPLAGTTAFAGAIAWALGQLGLGWLRCNSNPFNNNKNACNLWGDLAGLLGLATAVLAAEDFEKLVREMQGLEDIAIGATKDLFNLP